MQTVSQAVALNFLRAHHYAAGGANTSAYRHGLFRDDPALRPLVGECMGVALWMPPTPQAAKSVHHDQHQVLALSRFAVHPDVPKNGASFFLARSMKLLDRKVWPVLLTYADTRLGHTGTIYKATNWECLGEVEGRPTWTTPTGEQRGPKRGPRNLTRAEMRAMGYVMSDPQPKIKFVHRTRQKETR